MEKIRKYKKIEFYVFLLILFTYIIYLYYLLILFTNIFTKMSTNKENKIILPIISFCVGKENNNCHLLDESDSYVKIYDGGSKTLPSNVPVYKKTKQPDGTFGPHEEYVGGGTYVSTLDPTYKTTEKYFAKHAILPECDVCKDGWNDDENSLCYCEDLNSTAGDLVEVYPSSCPI